MKKISVRPIPTDEVRAFQQGVRDAHAMPPERQAQGGGPCRHCLQMIQNQEEMLVLAYRPFDHPQPYAETGPIFLHARACSAYDWDDVIPPMFDAWGSALMIVRGYGDDDRIIYESARVTPADQLDPVCRELLGHSNIAYLHVRAGATNCYQFRVERGL